MAVEMPPQARWCDRDLSVMRQTSILTPLLDYIPDGDVDVLVVLACVRLRSLAPALPWSLGSLGHRHRYVGNFVKVNVTLGENGTGT